MMKARFLALALILAWPSFAHAGWIYDNIGHPITGGLGLGAHLIKGAMVTGAAETKGAFGSAAQQAGINKSRSDPAPSVGASAGSSDTLVPIGADRRLPNAQPRPGASTPGR
jgi:hypothetical protein